ncbi:PREDICTED: ornithine aminotransferase, mitochondrial-like [Camelina sativa]|uniref:Ornithine aminotransferase n=1 Tax=Camelina sativa TaxID=90675 RepID=A0ABM0X6J1_CAMSA|nr:PREDICTED: ornithine aminotransferase, mitochondrial-like [Camelina sativa]
MAATTRRLLQCASKRVSTYAGVRRSYGGVPQSNSNSPPSYSSSSQRLIELESEFSAHNYHPVPVVFSRANGSTIWDPEGKRYIDFLAAYSAVNQGHCHPKIMKALQEQVEKLTLSSRAFYNDKFPVFAERLTNMFGYDMVLPMNTGAEGVETALKVARKWGHENKNIPKDEAIIVSCCGCFHGRTLAVISMSCDNDATRGFGPLLPGNLKVDFGDANSLKKIFEEKGDKIAGFLFEPIQGEAGVIIPPDGYLKSVRELCTKHNVLMIADEVQSGLARSGKMLACDWEDIRPDMVILGKALGGGVIPVSAVLADKHVMLHIKPGQHGSTFGGNPLASAVAMASLDVIEEEKLVERSASLGDELRIQLNEIKKQFPKYIKEVRGRRLFNAVEFNTESLSPVSAYDICLSLKERGVLAKPTHNTIVRLTPPLSISSDELREGSKALRDVLELDLPNLPNSGKTPVSHLTECDRCGRSLYA